jgi:hypothetical protein
MSIGSETGRLKAARLIHEQLREDEQTTRFARHDLKRAFEEAEVEHTRTHTAMLAAGRVVEYLKARME